MSKESPVLGVSLPASLLGYGAESVASTQEDVLRLFDECAPGLRRYVSAFGLTAEVTEDEVDAIVAAVAELAANPPVAAESR